MIKKDIDRFDIELQLVQFLAKYDKYIVGYERDHILNHWEEDDYFGVLDDVEAQVFDEIGLLVDDNIYERFIEVIRENHSLDQNIIEIGAGRFYRLAQRIAQKQKTGTITAYDPRIIRTEHPQHLYLEKKIFRPTTPILDCSLLVAMRPCGSINMIVDRACKEDKDFVLLPCACELGDIKLPTIEMAIELFKPYVDAIAEKVANSNLGTLETVSMVEYNEAAPIIYNKRRKC